jgi:hypothetical protein
VQWTSARRCARVTFVVLSVFSRLALVETVRRVVDGGITSGRHVAAPAGLMVVTVSIKFARSSPNALSLTWQ